MADGNLVHMQERVEQSMAGLGFACEPRAFSPHLTLGRVREGAGVVYLRAVREALTVSAPETALRFSVSKVTLYRSQLRPEGALYSSLAEFPLEAGA
jgi:2'-5' RNA ligase